MAFDEFTANKTIPIGNTYDTTKFILGTIFSNNTVELIPKITSIQYKNLSLLTSFKVGYKIYNVDLMKMLWWDGASFNIINDTVASELTSNTTDGQTLIDVSDTPAPTAGQVLTAISPTKAKWLNILANPVYNISYITNIGDGVSTTITVTHNLNTESIIFGVWETGGSKRAIDCTASIINVNRITLHFTTAPAYNAYKVIIISSITVQSINFPSELPDQTGQSGKFLRTDGMSPYWDIVPLWMINPMSAVGDLIVGGTSGAAGRLAIGTDNQVLTVSGTSTIWKTLIPTVSGQSGKVLSNDGTIASWQVFTSVPSVSGQTDKVLSNNGSIPHWITNTAPPSVTGQSGKFLSNDGNTTSWTSVSQVPSPSGHAGQVLYADGSSWWWNTISAVLGVSSGNNGKFLSSTGSIVSWETPPTGFSNPMTSIGDLIYSNDAIGTASRLAIGTSGQILTVNSSGRPAWTTSTALTNPMTSQYDLVMGGASGVPDRLAKSSDKRVLHSTGSVVGWYQSELVPYVTGHAGSWLYTDGSTVYWNTFTTIPAQSGHNGHVLTTDGTNVSWVANPAGFTNPMTTLGDMITGSSGGAASRLPIGTDGKILAVVSGSPGWIDNVIGLPTQTGNNGKHLTTNGTAASWVQIYQVPSPTGNSGKFLGNDGSSYSWLTLPNQLPSVSGQAGKYLSNDGSNPSWVPYDGLPSMTGNSGKILSTDGSTAFWITEGSGGGGTVLSRLPITVTSSSLAILTGEIKTVDTTCKTFQIQSIVANNPCRLRIYGTSAAATSDYSRLASLDPTGNHKMYAELIFTQALSSLILSPIPTCANDDTVTTTNIYMTIENTGTTTTTIQLDFVLLKLE